TNHASCAREIGNRQSKIGNALSDSNHLLPKKLSDFAKGGQHVLVIPGVGRFQWQSQITKIRRQFRIRRADVFVAAFAREPSVESTTNRTPLFERRRGDKSSAQIVH